MSPWRWALLALATAGTIVLSMLVSGVVRASLERIGAPGIVVEIAANISALTIGMLGGYCAGIARRIWTAP